MLQLKNASNKTCQDNNHKKQVGIRMLVLCFFLSQSLLSFSETTIAIKGGTVLTMDGKTIKKGTVLIRDTKIVSVGKNVEIPSDAKIVDATGKFVMPGIIDAMSYYGIRPADRNDTSNPVTPENRIIRAFSPFEDFMSGKERKSRSEELLSGGITTIYIAPGNRQVIGGQGAVVKTWGEDLNDLIVLEPAAIDISMGDPVKSTYGEKNRSPLTRMSIAAKIRKTLINGQEYVRKLEEASKKKEGREKKGKNKEKEKEGNEPPKLPVDPGMEAIAKLLNKKIPARFEANITDDIRTAIRIADEFDIDIIIDSATGAHKIKDQLSKRKIPVVLSPLSHPFMSGYSVTLTPEMYTLRDERIAAILAKAGVKIALASFGYGTGYQGSSFQGRWLLLEAALATGFGLSEKDALKAVTINAAEILGVDDRIGTLEKGKDADIIILDGFPLDVKTWVDKVFINGEQVYNRQK